MVWAFEISKPPTASAIHGPLSQTVPPTGKQAFKYLGL